MLKKLDGPRWVQRLPLAFILILFSLPAWANDEFPGRALFSLVTPLDTPGLQSKFDQVAIVDVRSRYEYETLHIKGAVHIALYDDKFADKVRQLQESTGKTVVFYCNGRTCYKSYKAADKARAAGITNVEAYDPGIFDWAQASPNLAVLLGEELKDTSRLLSKADFNKHVLSPDDFADLVAADDNPLVLDIRSSSQRRSVGLFVFKENNISLEQRDKLDAFIEKAKTTGKPLLVYDMAGKQVRWLQYYLEAKGLTNYHFMAGGYRSFLKTAQR